jgi:hypothetical protein
MISGLEEVDAIGAYEIYNSMLLSQSPRPGARGKIFQRLGLSDASEWIPQDCFNKGERPQRNLTLGLNPITQVFAELRMKHGVTGTPRGARRLISCQCPSLGEAWLSSWVWFGDSMRGSTP